MSKSTCADIHRELFPTYDELLLECCRKEAALIRAEAEIERARQELVMWGEGKRKGEA